MTAGLRHKRRMCCQHRDVTPHFEEKLRMSPTCLPSTEHVLPLGVAGCDFIPLQFHSLFLTGTRKWSGNFLPLMPGGWLWSVHNSLPLLFLPPPISPLLQGTSSLGQQSFRINLLQCGLSPGHSSFGKWSTYRIQAGRSVPDRSGAAGAWLDMHMLNSYSLSCCWAWQASTFINTM